MEFLKLKRDIQKNNIVDIDRHDWDNLEVI